MFAMIRTSTGAALLVSALVCQAYSGALRIHVAVEHAEPGAHHSHHANSSHDENPSPDRAHAEHLLPDGDSHPGAASHPDRELCGAVDHSHELIPSAGSLARTAGHGDHLQCFAVAARETRELRPSRTSTPRYHADRHAALPPPERNFILRL